MSQSKPTPPKCETCHTTAGVHYAPRPGQIPGAAFANRWICGACEYRENHDNAVLLAKAPRVKEPQSETLLDLAAKREHEAGHRTP